MGDKSRYNVETIAKRLMDIEQRAPGSVCLRVNPDKAHKVVEILEETGLEKGFFQRKQQFIIDSFLNQPGVAERLLPSTVLVGPLNENEIPCWTGAGSFIGFQGLAESTDFEKGGKEKVLLLINIEPFFNHISGILAEPIRVATEEQVDFWKYDND